MNQQKGMAVKSGEDWMSVWIGLFIWGIALAGALAGRDFLGWGTVAGVWARVGKSLVPVSGNYTWMPGWESVLCTYLFLLIALVAGARLLRYDLRKFVVGFSLIYWISLGCMFVGSNAYVAATLNQRKGFGIGWSLGLTSEAGFILALLAGVAISTIGSFSGTASRLKEAVRPEWYIKIALVLLGAFLGVQIAGAGNLAKTIMLRGFVAVAVVYLIYWALAFLVAHKLFHFDREDSAVFASAISICGVAAAAATGAAVKARSSVIAMVSSIVVIFSVVEIMILPFVVGNFLYRDPLVAGSFMAMAVKTDGAAVASGTITEAVVQAKALAVTGAGYKDGWILMTTTTEKMLIDLFIGIFAFILAAIWTYRINRIPGEKIHAIQIWERFPKFILGFLAAFLATLLLSFHSPEMFRAVKLAAVESNGFRVIFFAMTFLSIGLAVDAKRFLKEGLGKMTAAYAVCLVGIIFPVGLAVSWLFFHGIMPPAK
ncbi:MAG: putative sulfate exporter family transporter [Candidatus Pacebacteria bacterium]|nr:putative sulfate exporter family transporter [Candidatus Paceibacterota bacterium]